jgi:hypothetical protein
MMLINAKAMTEEVEGRLSAAFDAVGKLGSLASDYALAARLEADAPALVPVLGDPVEKWLKVTRDQYRKSTGEFSRSQAWCVLDNLLDEYRRHAAAAVPLDQEV